MPRKRFLLNADRIRARMGELGLASVHVAQRCRISERQFANWIARSEDARARVSEADVEDLAEILEIGTTEICKEVPVEYEHAAEVRSLDIARDQLSSGSIRDLLALGDRYSSYLAFLSFRFWPTRGFVKAFRHDGTVKNAYAEIQIRSLVSLREHPAKFIFAYEFGPLRVDYGHVQVSNGRLELVEYFTSHSYSSLLAGDNSFIVWTWFGRERCRFVIRSAVDFQIDGPKLDSAHNRDPDNMQPGGVCFRAAPHHVRDAVSDGARANHLMEAAGRFGFEF